MVRTALTVPDSVKQSLVDNLTAIINHNEYSGRDTTLVKTLIPIVLTSTINLLTKAPEGYESDDVPETDAQIYTNKKVDEAVLETMKTHFPELIGIEEKRVSLGGQSQFMVLSTKFYEEKDSNGHLGRAIVDYVGDSEAMANEVMDECSSKYSGNTTTSLGKTKQWFPITKMTSDGAEWVDISKEEEGRGQKNRREREKVMDEARRRKKKIEDKLPNDPIDRLLKFINLIAAADSRVKGKRDELNDVNREFLDVKTDFQKNESLLNLFTQASSRMKERLSEVNDEDEVDAQMEEFFKMAKRSIELVFPKTDVEELIVRAKGKGKAKA
jgi:hypothetical protein